MEWYIGEIRLFAEILKMDPEQWILCDGRTLPITKYQALYALLGPIYGGDGKTTFGIPDLRGRAIVGANASAGSGGGYSVGSKGGASSVALTEKQIPAHAHWFQVFNGPANTTKLADGVYAQVSSPQQKPLYVDWQDARAVEIDPDTIQHSGGGLPHPNMQPSIAMAYYIAVVGNWPTRP